MTTSRPSPPANLDFPSRVTLATALAALAVGISLLVDTEPLIVVGFLFVVIVPFEKFRPRHRGQRIRRPQVGTDIAHALLSTLLTPVSITVGVLIGLFSLAWLPGLALRPLVAMIPPTVMPVLGIVMFDFAFYWVHRWSHEVPVMWRFHAVHHSTNELDWVSGFRTHPIDGAIGAPAFAFLLAAGFSAEFSGALVLIQIVTGLFLHANVRFLWRPLHKIVITPEFHHWHHTNEPDAINTNYSIFLPIWDLAFGTYFMPKQRRPEAYGISEHMPSGVLAQLIYPFRGMTNPVVLLWRALRHPIWSAKRLGSHVWSVVGHVWLSIRRPTRSKHTTHDWIQCRERENREIA